MKLKRTAKFWLAISLVICLVSALGASMVQTNFGKVTVKDMQWETSSGHMMSALLFVPENATAENPAPGIVASHGWYNNREMQDLNFVEYARRGYVVISIDMFGHGNSDVLPAGDWWKPENNANGLYDAVKLMADLPYVDSSRIGVTGHSNGALASRNAVLLDNQATEQLISAALLVSNDAIYTDADGKYINAFGSRDVGVVACQYDEFFHRVKQEDGSRSAPRDYIKQTTAQSFLNFGVDPTGLPSRAAETVYTQEIDGTSAMRAIYNPGQIHPWAHFSADVVESSVGFFDEALSAPVTIPGSNQVWQWKAFFNAIGLVGFVLFLVNFALVLLDCKPFAALKSNTTVAALPAPAGKGKGWFWGGLAAGTIFSMLCYMLLYKPLSASPLAKLFPQTPVLYIGAWAALCGLFTLLSLWLSYRFSGKASGLDLRERGITISLPILGRTILMAVVVTAAAYGLVFAADYFFKVDFRLWVIPLKAFGPDKFQYILIYLPFFLLYYIINSIATNGFNYVQQGKKDWVNTAVVAVFNGLSPVILVAWMYLTFWQSGYLPMETMGIGGSIIGIWLFPIIIILPAAAVISRILYKATRNPYLPGIIMALVMTIMSCTNTLTQF